MTRNTQDLPIAFCIGAQKAGTTWLYNYLLSHPAVHVPPVKEVHYFDTLFAKQSSKIVELRKERLARFQSSFSSRFRQFVKARLNPQGERHDFGICTPSEFKALVRMHCEPSDSHERYRRFLKLRYKRQPVIADVTPGYDVLNADQFADIFRAFPKAKFVYIMRDPVSRSYSHIRMSYSRQKRKLGGVSFASFVDDIAAGRRSARDYIEKSRYPRVLRSLEAAVPKDRILYLFYEDLFSDESMARLCDFLGIGFEAGDYGRVVHEGYGLGEIDPALLRYLQDGLSGIYTQMQKRFGAGLPSAWKEMAAPRADTM